MLRVVDETCDKLSRVFVQLVAAHKVSADAVRLYLQSSESARELVGQYFDKRIYFAYTHLVCRTAIDGLSAFYCTVFLLLEY